MGEKIRVSLTLNEETVAYIKTHQEENNFRWPSDALDNLVSRLVNVPGENLVGDVLATAVAEKVMEGLKNDLTGFRIRTGYVDKQTKAMLEVLNHMIIKLALDGEHIITTDVRKANALQVSQDKIQREIEHFKQAKHSKQATSKQGPS